MKNHIIYKNGRIYTLDSKERVLEAMEIKDGRIINIGSNIEFFHKNSDAEIIDLDGAVVLPGICDCHVHPVIFGSTSLGIDAYDKTKEAILEEVSEMAKTLPESKWIVGMGWNQDYWTDSSFPTKEELDAVAPNHAVKLTRYCGHASWCNSKALKLAGLDGIFDPSVKDEGILLDATGHLAGTIYRNHCKMVDDAKTTYDEEDHKLMLKATQKEFLKNGITSAIDKGAGAEAPLSTDCGRKAISALKSLYESGEMKCRFYEEVVVSDEFLEDCYSNGPEISLYDDKFTLRGIKLWADGAMGARSAWLSEDYKDRKGFRGNPQYSDEELIKIFKDADKHGYQVSIHAIGDATSKQVIDCYEKAFVGDLYKDRRFMIEHFHIPTNEDVARLLKYNIILSTQFIQFSSDMKALSNILPDHMLQRIYPWREVLDGGGVLCSGSDVPIDAPLPFPALYSAVTRKSVEGVNCLETPPYKSLTRLEAIRAFTTAAAYTMFKEDVLGSLEKGKHADFIVIDKDYFQCAEEEIKDIQVLKTVIAGEEVYNKTSTN